MPSASCTDIEFEGEGAPELLIASDLPLQGSSRTQTLQMTAAIRQVLSAPGGRLVTSRSAISRVMTRRRRRGSGIRASARRTRTPTRRTSRCVALIGTFNSGCAAIVIPVLNQAPGGGLAMISPANTYVCLTEGGPGCAENEPDKYYPAGTRNYPRVVAHDAYQGAALAEFMQEQGTTSLYILNDREAYGLGVATNVRNAAEALGIEIAGFEAWDPRASNYEALMRQVRPVGGGRPVPGRVDRRERRPGDQGQGDRARPQRRRREAVHAGRVHHPADDRRVRGWRTPAAPSSPSPVCRWRSSSRSRPRTSSPSSRRPSAASRSTPTPSTARRRPQIVIDAIAASDGTPRRRAREHVRGRGLGRLPGRLHLQRER